MAAIETLEELIASGRAKVVRTIRHGGNTNIARETQRERERGRKIYVHEKFTEIYEIEEKEETID